MPKHEERKQQIKVFLSAADHDRVRVAAALRRTGMADFCRRVVLDEAHRLVEEIQLPEEPRKLGK
jgi:uncharacterized protein (DUF1778 family)